MELLSRQGMLVDGVAYHDEAMAALSTTSFDLLLVDRALPDGEGLSPLRGPPQAGRPRPPAIVLTARTPRATSSKAWTAAPTIT